MDKEIWKDIEGYEGRYKISSLGRIAKKADRKNSLYECVLVRSTLLDSKGNELVILLGEQKQEIIPICQLVARVFLPKFKNCSKIRHINNNIHDNRAVNLEWINE